LRKLGCINVIHEKIDFFTSDRGEVIISNPPFSLKKQVFKRLFELDKPFILLVPIATLTKQYFTKYFKKCQIIIPQKRIQFVKDGQQTSASWLDVIYLCYNMNLQKDIIYLWKVDHTIIQKYQFYKKNNSDDYFFNRCFLNSEAELLVIIRSTSSASCSKKVQRGGRLCARRGRLKILLSVK
jgi:hypothetical protein